MWGRIYPHAVLLILANIILRASCKGSLTFLIDDTSSMTDDIRQVKSSVNRISNAVFNEKSSLIGNMVLVTFNDPDCVLDATNSVGKPRNQMGKRKVGRPQARWSDDLCRVAGSTWMRVAENRAKLRVFGEAYGAASSSVCSSGLLHTDDEAASYAQVRVVTDNRNTFKRTLDAVYAHNVYNPDCWEPSMNGLLLALNTSNRDSYIYVFTDAPARDYQDGRYVKELCQKKQSQIVFVLTGRCYDYHDPKAFDVYFDIAHACSGLAFDVTKSDVEQVLRTIEETIKGNKTVIKSAIVPAGVKKDIPFTIDDHTDYAIVSVSGRNVYLDIKGPSANIEKIMWNDNGKVVKLSNAKPGTYVATVMGQTKTSVVIVGRTDFFFTHGFSKLKPKSLGDTSLQPIADSNVHLSISVTDDHHTVKILSAQILDMNEKPIKSPLPLTEISKDFYVTDSFVAPSERFKIAVNGIVKATGKPIKRNVKIPITPAEPPKILPTNTKPTVEIAEGKATEIEYNSTVQLTCKVVAFPEPKIEWFNNYGGLMPSKMSLQEYPYKYISYMDLSYALKGDRYKCYAVNDAGRDEATINVVVKDPFTVKSAPSEITKLTYGKEGTITCDVTSRLPMDIHWVYADMITGQTRAIETSDKYVVSASRTQLTIKKMDLDLVGRYTCKVSLKNNKDVGQSFITRVKIDGLKAPQVSGVTSKNVRIGTPASIECKVDGAPKPTITWQFMDNSGSKFQPMPGSDKVLNIPRVEKKHAGRYKCVAMNNIGSAEHVTRLIVEFAPEIIKNTTTVVEGIEGDLALRIPCDVVGTPKPVITWKFKGATITPDSKYSIEDGTLVIQKPTEKDSSLYTCEAKNYISTVSTTFEATVEQLPTNFGTEHFVYLKQGETQKLKCDAYNSASQSVKWFTTKLRPQTLDSWLSTTPSPPPEFGSSETTTTSSKDSSTPTPIITKDTGITEPHIQITNASPTVHDGNYTCRVSDKHGNTHTHTYVVDVGSAPEFYSIATSSSLSDWGGLISDITENCDIRDNAKPTPVVEWKFNGKVLTDLNSAGLGHYTCKISNVHGSVQKTFDVKSSACLISRNMGNAHMPLVLDDKAFWHKLPNTKHYSVLAQEDKITLSCPSQKDMSNTFKNFIKKSTLEALCYKEDSFVVEGKIYKLSDLQCTNSIQPSVIRKKVKCSTETSELIRVGYNVPGFLEAYEVCFDTEKNMPLYTRIIMTETNNMGLSADYNWYTYPGIGITKTERGFTCKDTTSLGCYSKSQLVKAIDFNDGPAKRSTFIDPLNVIPVWRPYDTSKPSWESINEMVRSQLFTYTDIVTWSGTHTLQEKNGAIIPRYLWKVVRLDDDEALAIVHVNDPEPVEKDIKCKTYKCKADWFISSDKYTYCCSLPDFLKSFDIHATDIGESMDAVLDKIEKST